MDSPAASMTLKAQVSVVTIIIIAGIGISLAAIAYMWGMPLIEKRSTITDYLAALDFVKRLDNKIISVANSMAGQESLDIPRGLVMVIPHDADDPDNNSITLEFLGPQPMILDGSVYLDTDFLGETAVYGEAEPRTILFSGEKLGAGRNSFTFKLHYRELDTQAYPKKGYKIMLNDVTSTGKNRVTVSFDRTETLPGDAANNGNLILTYVDILVE